MTNKDYIEKYKNDDLIITTKFKDRSGSLIDGVVNPLEIDNRDLCVAPDDQTTTPHCAGYSCAKYLASIYWKKTGQLINLDAHQIYAKAKQIDGMVNIDGTSLEAVLTAGMKLCNLNEAGLKTLFNDRTLRTIENVKHLIHKYDILLGGFGITNKWYDVNFRNYVVNQGGTNVGGHAVIICGYNDLGFIIQNHWSQSWGAKGFAIVPYHVFIQQFMYCAYLTNMYDDFD